MLKAFFPNAGNVRDGKLLILANYGRFAACRVTATYKPFKFCGIDFFGPYTVLIGKIAAIVKLGDFCSRVLCTRGIDVELVTSFVGNFAVY